MRGAWRIARVAGVDLYIHWSFSLLILLVVWQGLWSGREVVGILYILAALLLLFGCVALHELGHALAARYLQVKVKRVVLFLVGGFVQIQTNPQKPWHEFLISFAGPFVNLVIALCLAVILFIVDIRLFFGFFKAPHTMIDSIFLQAPFWQNPVLGLVIFLLFANSVLFFFNLLPTFPMDGGRLLRALLALFLPYVRATQWAIGFGQLFALFLIILAWSHRNFGLLVIALFVLAAGLPILLSQKRFPTGDEA